MSADTEDPAVPDRSFQDEMRELVAKGIEQARAPADLYEALALAKLEFKAIERDREVEVRASAAKGGGFAYAYSYATLGNILSMVTEPLAKNGLVLIQRVVHPDGASYDYVETRLVHKTGQSIFNLTRMIQTEEGQVGFAKAQTYARRYGVQLLLCLAAEEDADAKEPEEQATYRPTRAQDADEAPVDPEVMDDYAKSLLRLLDAAKDAEARTIFDELSQNEQSFLWSKGGLTQKQKDRLRPPSGNTPPPAARGRRS